MTPEQDLQRWDGHLGALEVQLGEARTALAAARDQRGAVVLPARLGDAKAIKALAEADAAIAAGERAVADLQQALELAEGQRFGAEERAAEADRAARRAEAMLLETQAASLAEQIDGHLAALSAALRDSEELRRRADRLMKDEAPRRVPLQECLKRAFAHHRLGSIHSVHRPLIMPFAKAFGRAAPPRRRNQAAAAE
jgi:chromosome segregation ATPase